MNYKNTQIINAYINMISENISKHIKILPKTKAAIDKQPNADLSDSSKNIVAHSIKKFAPNYDINQKHPVSSIVHQYVIGKTNELASSGNPEYKSAVYNSYKKDKPEVTGDSKNYDELVKKSYGAASSETQKQFHSLPIATTFHHGDIEYKSSKHMVDDVHANHHLAVYSGGEPHTHLGAIAGKKVNANEMFRAVHDYYGHALHGNQFGPKGEEIAWNAHRQMYSDSAKPAVTAETRGQNSQVNYTSLNLKNLADMKNHRISANNSTTPEEKQKHLDMIKKIGNNFNYAKQVASVLPHEMNSPEYNGDVPHSIKHLLHDKQSDKNPTYDMKKDHLQLSALAKHHAPENHEEVALNLAKVHGYKNISKINESMVKLHDTLEDSDYASIKQKCPYNFE